MIRTLTNDNDTRLTTSQMHTLAEAYDNLSRALRSVGIGPEANSAKDIAMWYTRQTNDLKNW